MATKKQLKAIDNLVENGGNVSKAMRDAGYSANTANTPQKLTESKAFQEIMAGEITDESLVRVIKGGLNANKVIVSDNGLVEAPDHQTRHKYVETIIKVKGYAREGGNTFQFNFKGNANFNVEKYKE